MLLDAEDAARLQYADDLTEPRWKHFVVNKAVHAAHDDHHVDGARVDRELRRLAVDDEGLYFAVHLGGFDQERLPPLRVEGGALVGRSVRIAGRRDVLAFLRKRRRE